MPKMRQTRILEGRKVKDYDFPSDQFYEVNTHKSLIVLHHMASGTGIKGDLNWWLSNSSRVATCCAIQRNGDISTMFSSKNWAHALGIKIKEFDKFNIPRKYRIDSKGKKYVSNNEILNEKAIQVELDSWGQLTKKGNDFFSWTGKRIDKSLVHSYDSKFRGHHHYEKYTDESIRSLEKLLLYWNKTYNINVSFKGMIMFEQNKRALSGESGVWGHVSYRSDKNDIHPQPELISMLKTL